MGVFQMELFKAHNQWKSRPADERFKTLAELHAACLLHKNAAAETEVPFSQLRVEAQDGDLKLVGKTGVPANLTHWAMGQLCSQAGAPAGYLRDLPATLAAQNINHGLKARADQTSNAALLFNRDEGGLTLRASVSEKYTRIWNADVTGKLLRLVESNPNWENPLAYKVITPGTDGKWPVYSSEMEPSGLYASAQDMFAFMVDESKTLEGSPMGLNRGFFVWNSEVGSSSFGVMTFLYDRVCGNNIVWGAKDVAEIRVRHVGNADAKAFNQLQVELVKYAESAAGGIETMIKKARAHSLGRNADEVLDSVFGIANKIRTPELTKVRVKEAIELAETRRDRYGDPYSVWGVVGGLTEASQNSVHTDERVKVDRAAGKFLKSFEF
jgi:hypothetical protein